MKESNEMQIVEEIKDDLQNWMLEQQLTNLENTLSDTISFFSTTFAIVGIAVAILLVFSGWWLNKLFNVKLEKVQESSGLVSEHKTDIENIEKEVTKKFNSIVNLEGLLQEATDKLQDQEEINNFLEVENNYLKERCEFILTLIKFQRVIIKSEECLSIIDDNLVKNSKWGSKFEDPLDEYKSNKGSYVGAKSIFDHYVDSEYQLVDYLGDVDEGEQGEELEELKDELESAQDFYLLLLEIIEK